MLITKNDIQLIDSMGSDRTVVNAARVSFGVSLEEDQTLMEKDEKLISYLAKHDHWTPFAHCMLTFYIRAPIAIRTQFFKHKVGFTENEISRRYTTKPPKIYLPAFREKPEGSIKQGSGKMLEGDKAKMAEDLYDASVALARDTYNSLILAGVCPEQARFVLPQATYTEWYWTGSLAAYARFYKLRTADHAQSEIKYYAKYIGNIIQPLFPVSWDALVNSTSSSE